MKKLCKRMLALVTALVLVTGTFTAIPALGNEFSYDGNDVGNSPIIDFWIGVLSQPAAPGQYVDVVLALYNNAFGLNTLGLTVTYDSDVLQSVNVTPGNLMTMPTPPIAGENPMQLGFYSANPLANFESGHIGGVGSFAVIRFRIHDNAPSGSTPITVTATHAYAIDNNDNLFCFLRSIGISNGVVNVCPPYCECLNCANESDLPNLLMINTPFQIKSPIRINCWQVLTGDWGLPTTVEMVVTSANPRVTASISWGPLISRNPYIRWMPEFYSVGTVTLPYGVTNINSVWLGERAWVDVLRQPNCDCPWCQYEAYRAWLAEIERQRIAYEEWRAWEAAVEHARIEHEAYIAWRTAVDEAEAAHQAYLDWLEAIKQAEREYQEWREWLCATNQCGGCTRCFPPSTGPYCILPPSL